MATLQVKGFDDRLYEALRARAAMQNRSVSQEVVTMIRQCLSRPPEDPRAAMSAALELAGTWQDERSAQEIIDEVMAHRRTGRRFDPQSDVFD